MLTQDDNLSFLQRKIGEIKVAMFRSEINCELQLPTNIISTLKTDNDGNIWFFTSCNGKYAKNIDKSFYAYLDYYQKGGAYRLRVSGKASIVQDDPMAHASEIKPTKDNIALIQFKIMHAEYFENKSLATSSLKTRIKDFFTEIFSSHNYREFDFPEPAM